MWNECYDAGQALSIYDGRWMRVLQSYVMTRYYSCVKPIYYIPCQPMNRMMDPSSRFLGFVSSAHQASS